MADMHPATYRELIGLVEQLRSSHYLDGPNDVDWIFRNEIEAYREDRLYVDFVETDEGDEWLSPAHWDDEFNITSGAVRLMAALHLSGFSTTLALSVVADAWEGLYPAHGHPLD
jgi:hypothetical protein